LSELARQYPAYQAEIDLLGRCGVSLAQVLRHEADPLALLFPDGSFEELERIYGGSPVAQVYNALLREVVAEAVGSLPSSDNLRILEIGAGTGATTSGVLEVLADKRLEYTFTDLSPLFLERAKDKFAAYPNLVCRLLNIEENPIEQGFTQGDYQLVLAANVLHATRDLRETLENVNQLLAPGGVLVMLEGSLPQSWVDMTFGLTEGWWRFTDHDLRPDYPLLKANEWAEVLSDKGFTEIVPLDFGDASGQMVIVAKKSAESIEPVAKRPIEWLIFSDQSGFGAQIAQQFTAQGQRSALVLPAGSSYSNGSSDVLHLDLKNDRALEQLLAEPTLSDLKGVVYLAGWGSTDDQPMSEAAEADTASLLLLTQALARLNQQTALWIVTAGAQPVDNQVSDPASAALWGLGRVIALEYPEWWGGIVDLDPDAPSAEAVVSEIVASDGEDQVAYRQGERYVARLTHARATKPASISFDPNASYLITGGLGGLGLNLAIWMAENGARHLTLLGRSALPERSQWASLPPNSDQRRRVEGIQTLEALGAQVTVHSGDVGDYQQMATLFAQYGQQLPPLKGIIHAAAALSNWPLADMPLDALAGQFGAKVGGAVVLDQLTRDMALDFFVMFSSTTALWGVRELGHYAAANTFLDAFAYDQRSRGVPSFTINWGTWAEMRITSAEERVAVAQYGLRPMSSDQAIGILGDVLVDQSMSQLAVASVDWALLKSAYEARRQRPIFEYMGVVQEVEAPSKTDSQMPSLLAQLETIIPEERDAAILAHVRELAAAVLGASNPDMIDEHQGLFEMGMDSLMSVELKTRLERSVGKALPSTLTFNYPTVAELAEYLATNVLPQAVELPAPAEVPIEPTSVEDIDDLSEDDLADLLMKKLKGLQ
jgi:NAD(P)-dependent dehydrogenase (short-subunit alcohol dehydrogenase family)/SAM-dependent methyltransferase/acyl carrier protein